MKLSFSIQNWKGIRWNEFLRAAVSTRMSGIELYDIAGPVFAGKESPANPELAPSIRRRLISDGLSVSCINTVADFTDPSFMREMEECIRIAVNLGIPYIGIHTSSSDAGAALWDMYSTCYFAQEDAEKTITNLGAYVRHVHIHDYRKVDNEAVPELIGSGFLPLEELMNALRSINYDGFISLEWDPDWMPEIADMEIIFTHFVNVMNRFQSTRLNKKHLYWNNSHTGRYWTPWWRSFPIRWRSSTRPWIIPAPMRSSGTMWMSSPESWSPWAYGRGQR